MDTKTVTVPAISCGHCVRTIEREIAEVAGVAGVKADQATRRVTVSWDPALTEWARVEEQFREIGYPPDK